MEPMVTGSPTFYDAVSNTPGVNATPSRSFLPGYLMGHHHHYHRQDVRAPASNTAALNLGDDRSLMASTMSPSVRPPNLKVTWSPLLDSTNYYEPNNSAAFMQQEDAENYYNMTPRRPSAVGNFATTQGASACGPPTASFLESFQSKAVLNGSTLGIERNTPGSKSAQSNVVNAAVEDNSKIVTIFGFTAESIQFILQHFSQCGTILAHETANKCNWMHVKFESKLQASKALARNGRILNETLKIGVEQCRDEKAIRHLNEQTMSKEINNPLLKSVVSSPPPVSGYNASSSVKEQWDTPRSALGQNQPRNNMRSLTSYNGPLQEAASNDNGNLFSKAKNYIFGWQ